MKRRIGVLVEKMGFTVFAIEANWPESLAVNDYVLNGKGDPLAALVMRLPDSFDVIFFVNQTSPHVRTVRFPSR